MDRPSVVWLTIESTRFDHTSLDPGGPGTTPNLARIADRPGGRTFAQCHSHSVWTLPSSASILTGTYPSHHDAGMGSDAIPPSLPTVAESLREVGYDTTCISSNMHVSSGTGLDRGFDTFHWLSKSTLLDVARPSDLLGLARNLRTYSGGFTLDTARHSLGYLVNRVIERGIRRASNDDDPLFLYAHYGDPHHPYYPPLPYLREYASDLSMDVSEVLDLVAEHHDALNEHIAAGSPFDDAELAALQAMYDAEIAYTDDLVGEVFDAVRTHLDDAIVVVTADHGELFGEKGLFAHKIVLDDAVTHVPLVVHGMDALVDYDGETVQHADVVRTIVDAVGGDTSRMQGIDLRESVRDHSIVQRGAERCRRNLSTFEEINPEFDRSVYHDGSISAIRTTHFKFQLSADRSELYRLPDESEDVSGEYPAVASRLEERLTTWLDTEGAPLDDENRDGEFTDAMQRQLADLGYIE